MAGELRRFNKFKLPRRSLNSPIQKTRAGSSSGSVPSSREAVCRTLSTLARTLSTFNCWERKVNRVLYNQIGLSNDHRQICTRIAPLCVCTCIHTYVHTYVCKCAYACCICMCYIYGAGLHGKIFYVCTYVRMYVHMLGQRMYLFDRCVGDSLQHRHISFHAGPQLHSSIQDFLENLELLQATWCVGEDICLPSGDILEETGHGVDLLLELRGGNIRTSIRT